MTGGSCLIEVKWSVQRVPSGGSVSGNGGLERLAAATGVWLVVGLRGCFVGFHR